MKLKTKKKLVVDRDCLEEAILEHLRNAGPSSLNKIWDALWEWGRPSDISWYRVALQDLINSGKVKEAESSDDRTKFELA